MGKRLKQQIRGRGTPRYKAPSHRYKAELKYPAYDDIQRESYLKGEVVDFVDDPGRSGLLALIALEDGRQIYLLAPEGLAVGDAVYLGAKAPLSLGSVLPLSAIPEGTYIFNIEKNPGDGGKFVRTAGSYAIVVSKEPERVYVRLPSKRIVTFNPSARAQVGVVAGGGIKEKPLLKAGNAYYKWKARNKLWPKNRGVKMSPYDHPFGGKQHHEGRPTTVARNAPPGQKVGHIAARQTGRRERKAKRKEG